MVKVEGAGMAERVAGMAMVVLESDMTPSYTRFMQIFCKTLLRKTGSLI
jgi:hypothetical protein